VAAVATYPCQNLRSRQQAGELAGKNAPTTLKGIIVNEGVLGLYRGLLPTLVHVTPNVCVVFLVYEFLVNNE
jgi:solute carrier family 25 folate transporter 32